MYVFQKKLIIHGLYSVILVLLYIFSIVNFAYDPKKYKRMHP